MKTRNALGVVLALSCAAWPARGRAYTTLTNVCGGPESWTNDGDVRVVDLACSANGFPGLTTSTDPSGNGYTQARQAMTDAMWMWVRDGQSDTRLYFDSATCGVGAEDGGWFPFDGRNEIWWETASRLNSPDLCRSTSAAACTPARVGACAWPGLHTDIFEFHMVVSNDWPRVVVNQDSLDECFNMGNNLENLFLHELGHAYGIGHDDAVMNSMNTVQQAHHNCHVAQGFSAFPYPDDTAALMRYNDRSPTTAQYNAAGTPWTWSNGMSLLNRLAVTAPASGSVTVPVFHSTIESMYPYTWTFFITFVVVSESARPTFDWASNAWSYTAVASAPAITASSWGQVARPLSSPSWSFPASALTRGVTYRVWGHIWSFNAETDLGDNLFPTAITLTRN